ncbi:MAG: type I methionyl aminopeptidase [Candidatus Buchananbacteria bacterium RIFCSPHIGHO2_02_FULL_45_11b]|uniref:Methionine aminopeptidase n=4 Tax=Candidatus Buchananiibacteriota TaxID=1817903 RepID=A0A1G1Y448_9BACT|nr:MAG: type I methionyl aminopeptidase [Candidatus Buchananbacteria bacterium RIFCSPHIGHO2_01_FULL_46_12]OGY50482.1 MAG: type I methionyl aminopeptidase [Candidatus Buchananbacteria bacterium RIFCSPHIGHO2_02_FULL_45_11b]OGY57059.1 MAG: type I methionyl aminopeptidase [Candidatus Buchananbacteria bacterium RIFCSPLOWO2_02_FULL_46_11b]
MITIKKPEEIEILRQGGRILAGILNDLIKAAKPGAKTIELDQLAERLILENGGIPSFKNYKGHADDRPFPTTICAAVNTQLVHAPAGDYALKTGDILSLDLGMKYPAQGKGFFTDMTITIPIGRVSPLARKVIKVTKTSLEVGLAQIREGNYISDISRAIQNYVESEGFSVVRQLVGHGVGYEVHEDPRIPNYLDPKQPPVQLKAGMVLAIEPMVNVGHYGVKTGADGWTVETADDNLCAHFEHTVAVTKDGCEILTLP